MPSPRHQSLDLRLRRRGLAYARELESVLDGVLASLLPELIREVERNPNVKTDALWGFGDWLAKVASATRRALSDRTLISRIKRQAAALDHMTVNELAGALAIDPAKIPGVPHIAESFVLRNAGLVRSLTDTYLDGVAAVLREAQPGVRAESLIAQIAERAQVTRSRARLIAVNETLTYHAETNRARQQRLGVQRYEWSASMDERTRPWHRDLDGQVFSWSDPPISGGTGKTDRGHPGDGILCRCVAVPRLDSVAAPSATEPPAASGRQAVQAQPAAVRAAGQALIAGSIGFLTGGMRNLQRFRDVTAGKSAREVTALATQMSQAPFDRPIRIEVGPDGHVELVDGRHRLQAAREAGAQQILAHVVERDGDGEIVQEATAPVPTGGNQFELIEGPGGRTLVRR